MGINIQTNLNLLRFMGNSYRTGLSLSTSLKRLSSGVRINSASDDAAGLSLSQQMTMRTNANNIAKNNTETGIAMLNTADSALSGMVTSLQRMRDLAVQSANGVYSDEERGMLQKEVDQLSDDISQNYNSAKFGSKQLFGSDFAGVKAVAQLQTAAAISAAGYDSAHTITSAADFASKISADMSGNFILSADVDLSTLGTVNNSIISGTFSGQLDGNGHKISNFHIDTGGAAVDNIGLFSQVSGTIKNLGAENFTVNATNSTYIGGLVGTINGGKIDNSYANGNVSGYMRIGVLAGRLDSAGTIQYSHSSGSCTSNGWSSGGLLGMSDNGSTVTKSYSSASITSTDLSSGGLVASQYNGSTISDSYATGSINGYANVGGIVGRNSYSTVTNCYATGDVFGSAGSVGSVVGWQEGGSVTNNYGTGNVSGSVLLGGVVGENWATVDNSNFYKNNMSTDAGSSVDANVSTPPTSGWNTSVWDLSGNLPKLKTFENTASSKITNLQVGTDADVNSQIAIDLGLNLGDIAFNISSQGSAVSSIDLIEETMSRINSKRSDIGANVNRLQGAITSQDNRLLNYTNANSTIKDSDIAAESAQLVKNQIIQNAASSLFSQAKNLDRDLAMKLLDNL